MTKQRDKIDIRNFTGNVLAMATGPAYTAVIHGHAHNHPKHAQATFVPSVVFARVALVKTVTFQGRRIMEVG